MSIFLVLMLVPDVGRRTHNYSEERWEHSAKPQQYDESIGDGEHGSEEAAEKSDKKSDKPHHD